MYLVSGFVYFNDISNQRTWLTTTPLPPRTHSRKPVDISFQCRASELPMEGRIATKADTLRCKSGREGKHYEKLFLLITNRTALFSAAIFIR